MTCFDDKLPINVHTDYVEVFAATKLSCCNMAKQLHGVIEIQLPEKYN
jgi:hypothetical protein